MVLAFGGAPPEGKNDLVVFIFIIFNFLPFI